MRFRYQLPLLLLVGWGLVDLGVLVAFMALDLAGRIKNVPWDPLFVGLITVQGSAVAAWFYLSDHWAGWHAASLLVLIVCLAACGPLPLWMAGTIAVHLLVLAVVHYPLGMLRDRGWRYRFHPPTTNERQVWQFSLAQLVGVTSVTALGLGLWQLLGWLDLPQTISVGRDWTLLVLNAAVLAWLPAVRVLAGMVRSGYLVAAAAVLGIVHLRLLAIYFRAGQADTGKVMLVMIVAGAAILVLQAVALRWAGWRIERDPRGHLRPRLSPALEPLAPTPDDAVHADANATHDSG